MHSLQVLLQESPLKRRLNELLDTKRVPMMYGARLRRRLGINCDPNECCARETASALIRSATELRNVLAQSDNSLIYDEAHYQLLLLLASVVEKKDALEVLREQRESDCVDVCDLSLPEGVGWMKLIDLVGKNTMQTLGGRRWLLWVAEKNGDERATDMLALSRSEQVQGPGSSPNPTGEVLYLSPRHLATLSFRWPDLVQRIQALCSALSDHYFICECWADIKAWPDLGSIAPELVNEVGKWFLGGPKAFLSAVASEKLGKLRIKMPESLEEAGRYVNFRNHWRLWANFNELVHQEKRALSRRRRATSL